jgi:hypothetical protein
LYFVLDGGFVSGFGLLLEHGSGGYHSHDCVGSLQNSVDSHIAEEALDGVIFQVSVSSVHLKRIVGDFEGLVAREELGHGTVDGGLRVLLVQHTRCVPHQQLASIQFGRHVRQFELQGLYGLEAHKQTRN